MNFTPSEREYIEFRKQMRRENQAEAEAQARQDLWRQYHVEDWINDAFKAQAEARALRRVEETKEAIRAELDQLQGGETPGK